MSETATPIIRIKKTFDPLTLGSYRNPSAPWVGLDPKDPLNVSPAIARLERLMQEYVDGGISSCSILIGGDRGAGKTSLVKKVIERLSWKQSQSSAAVTKEQIRWRFPRPLYVRVHGPRCMDFNLEVTEERDGASTMILRQVAEALHRAIVEEFGRAFAERAASSGNDEAFEQAAQFKVELDEGPDAASLREMWTLFAGNDHKPDSVLPGVYLEEAERQKIPVDQAYRELLAVTSSIQLVLEVRAHQAQEEKKARLKIPEEAKKEEQKEKEEQKQKDELAFWKELARQMFNSGRLINPLAGFLVSAFVFVSVLRAGIGLPLGILIALISGFSTTILLNFATARRYSHSLLSDSKLAAMDRMLPVVLRRLEHAGLFPIIVIDELDKVPENDLAQRMNHLIRDLKNFVADQAFVCFLVGRKYYEQVLEASAGKADQRRPVDTFFSDRILVSHTPDSLLSYLDELLEPEDQSNEETNRACEFLKHLYLYRAKGHLGDLQEAIAADHKLDYSVVLTGAEKLYEVLEYRHQVCYQLAVHKVVSDRFTQKTLRQKPDLLQPLNQALYGPADNWESGEWSFVPTDFGQSIREKPTADANFCIEPLERLTAFLLQPGSLVWDISTCTSQRLIDDLTILGPGLLIESGNADPIKPLIRPDLRTPPERYFWEVGFRENQELTDPDLDTYLMVRFRDKEEGKAITGLNALSRCLSNISNSSVSVASLCDLKTAKTGPWTGCLVDYTFGYGLSWSELRLIADEDRRKKETCELYNAIVKSCAEVRGLLLAACLGLGEDEPHVSWDRLNRLFLVSSSKAADLSDVNRQLSEAIDNLESSLGVTSETSRAINGITKIDPYNLSAWCMEIEFIAARIRKTRKSD